MPDRRVLVVDDDPLILQTVTEILTEEGYEVVGQAADGRQAIDLAEELRPDLVITDVKMPVLDGLAALTALYSPLKGKTQADTWEMVNPHVTVSGDMGLLTFNYVSAKGGVTWRWNTTEVYRRIDGQWKIIHTHWSLTQPELKIPIE